MADTAAPAVNGSNSDAVAENHPKMKVRRRNKKKKDNRATPNGNATPAEPRKRADNISVEVEYVAEPVPSKDDSMMAIFSDVFNKFSATAADNDEEDHAADAGDKEDASGSASEAESEEDKVPKKLSKKKLRKLNRLSVADLKQLVKRPEVVEWVDVTSTDPKLLVALKSIRNTVPVPHHWSQKRKYLQGKRGLEKTLFELPDFVRETGIAEMRAAVKEKEDAAKLKTKTRERLQPKMGKLDLDYQKLHDAFFRFQTKPKLTRHGELYYEGKEFEAKYKEKKPGMLSEELKQALGMPPFAPPPWLINMQRYGPPPSYPNLKTPGLNAPIPYGAQWGYHPGGWGKPPVDEFNRPLYGDVFGMGAQSAPEGMTEPIERDLWGEVKSEEELSEAEVSEGEEEEGQTAAGSVPQDGMVTPSGIASVVSIPAGIETPDHIQLRKEIRKAPEPEEQDEKPLYHVLPQKDTSITGFMGSQHTYDIGAIGARGSTRQSRGVEVTLDPSELASLDQDALQAKLDAMQTQQTGQQHEDFSDMVAEHESRQAAKRKRTAGDAGPSKK